MKTFARLAPILALAATLTSAQDTSTKAQAAPNGAKAGPTAAAAAEATDKAAFQALTWRNIGPFRGGRSVAVTGVEGQPMTYYFGSTGGGVFKTTNGGAEWKPVTDGQLGTGSV